MQRVEKAKTMRTSVEQVRGKSLTIETIEVVLLVVTSRILAMVDWKEMLKFRTTSSSTTFVQTSSPASFSRHRGEAARIVHQVLCKSN